MVCRNCKLGQSPSVRNEMHALNLLARSKKEKRGGGGKKDKAGGPLTVSSIRVVGVSD